MSKDKLVKTLEDEGIDIKQGPFFVEDCPDDVRELFQLVHDVKGLQFESFARYTSGGSESNPKPRIQAAHVYDKWLKEQAEDLSTRCNNPDLEDRKEVEWIQALDPVAFFRFDRDLEERANFHHCFVCRRHYPQHSRPFINRSSERLLKKKSPVDCEICEQQHKHINLPNFAKRRELDWYNDGNAHQDTVSHLKDKNKKKGSATTENSSQRYETPDLTVGLCTYALHESPWSDRPDLLELDQVNLFGRAQLADLRNHFDLPAPYRLAKKRIRDSTPEFAFALWEAKSAIAENNSLAMLMQSAKKVRAMLRCQDQVFEKSSIPGVPIAWYFNNIGPHWTVYGCHVKRMKECQTLRAIKLWDGELTHEDKALQLLYIVDMIAIWAEHSYKPSICSCMSSLKALKDGKNPFDIVANSRVQKLDLNRENFPWLLNPVWNTYPPEQAHNTSLQFSGEQITQQRRHSLRSRTTATSRDRSGARPLLEKPNFSWSTRSLSQSPNRYRSDGQLSRHLSPRYAITRSPSQNLIESMSKQISSTSSEITYVNPDLENYIWIQDKDPGFANILVLKIDQGGTILKPTIVFDSQLWQDHEFSQLVTHESLRWDSDVDTKFLLDRKQKHYLRKLTYEFLIDSTKPGIQFCAIFPLDEGQYRSSSRDISENDDMFRPIEALLNIPALLHAIKISASRWCACRKPHNEFSPDMVLCDNANCKIGWYHLRCLLLDKAPEFWLCPECEATDPSTHIYSEDSNVDYDEEIYEESSGRVQMTKAIARVWLKHKWPGKNKLLNEMEKASRRIVFDSSVRYKVPKGGNFRERAPLGCWAVPKESRKKPQIIKVAPSGLAFDIRSP